MKRTYYVEEGVPVVSYDLNKDSNGDMPIKRVNVFNGRRVEEFLNPFQGKKIRVTIELLEEDLTNVLEKF
ncbi:hypothetical protein [Pseudalkalibacillus sp. SCS-8]|uniref:hypothetical protein n=1 Tax=Pseudalkalibacillus nanhaiensis TaxID=3115291 RepID=UPI0032DA3E34